MTIALIALALLAAFIVLVLPIAMCVWAGYSRFAPFIFITETIAATGVAGGYDVTGALIAWGTVSVLVGIALLGANLRPAGHPPEVRDADI